MSKDKEYTELTKGIVLEYPPFYSRPPIYRLTDSRSLVMVVTLELTLQLTLQLVARFRTLRPGACRFRPNWFRFRKPADSSDFSRIFKMVAAWAHIVAAWAYIITASAHIIAAWAHMVAT